MKKNLKQYIESISIIYGTYLKLNYKICQHTFMQYRIPD